MHLDESVRQQLFEEYAPERAQAIWDLLVQLQENTGLPPGSPTDEVALTLRIRGVGRPERSHPLPPGVHVIGRWRNCDIHLADHTVSRIHCVLEVRRDRTVHVCDIQSAFGTVVRGAALSPWQWCEVAEGNVITVGEQTLLELCRAP